MGLRAAAIYVTGKVQGVHFRQSAETKANTLHIKGTVKNLGDGRVELRVFGNEEAIGRLIEWCHSGPPAARVENVRVEPIELFEANGFEIIH